VFKEDIPSELPTINPHRLTQVGAPSSGSCSSIYANPGFHTTTDKARALIDKDAFDTGGPGTDIKMPTGER